MTSAAIIGGGFYGACLALFLQEGGIDVHLYERETELLTRASTINQARVHTGYHYPRDLITAHRSFANIPRFMEDFKAAVFDDFDCLYCVARVGSKVSATAFESMFRQMGAFIKPAAPKFQGLFNPELIESVFEVKEAVFDASILRDILRNKMDLEGVEIHMKTEIWTIRPDKGGGYGLYDKENNRLNRTDLVFNCTYSQLNHLRVRSELPLLPIRNEITEMAVVDVPPELKDIGVTVMDGPFFSLMPFPLRKMHTLSHVRYTPHCNWMETEAKNMVDADREIAKGTIISNYLYMIKDASRYMPSLADCKFMESLFEVKTILPRNDGNDGRPILFREDLLMPRSYTVMGAKIDNIYDFIDIMRPIRDALVAEGASVQSISATDGR